MRYHLNSLDEPVFMAGPKHIQAEFGNHQRLESCGDVYIYCILSLETFGKKLGIGCGTFIYLRK